MKTFFGIVATVLGAYLIKGSGANVELAAGIFCLVFGGVSIMTARKISLNHL